MCQFLEFEMQSGQLGLVAYLQRLKDRLLVDKNLAVSLNREGMFGSPYAV